MSQALMASLVWAVTGLGAGALFGATFRTALRGGGPTGMHRAR